MTNAERLRRSSRAIRAAIKTSRGLPSEDAFDLVRDAALVAVKVMDSLADDLESE